MKPFEEAWTKASVIDGWLAKDEAEALYHHAALAPDGRIVEVGSYRGKSAVLLAHLGGSVICVDPLIPCKDKENNMVITENDANIFALNIQPYPIIWLQEKSTDAAKKISPTVAFLYIDGSHIEPHPKNDFEAFEPKLIPGARVAFHDYGSFPGVSKAIIELVDSGKLVHNRTVRSMWLGKVCK